MKKHNVIELIGREAITDPLTELLMTGVRESTQGWREVLLKLKSRADTFNSSSGIKMWDSTIGRM